MTDNEYIYLLQEREFIRMNEPIYKIGKTTQENHTRFFQYPKGSKLLLQIICDNCHINEKLIKKTFNKKYKQRKDYGIEYFEGDLKYMIMDIFKIVHNQRNNEIEMNNDSQEYIYNKDLDDLIEQNKALEDEIDKLKNKLHVELLKIQIYDELTKKNRVEYYKLKKLKEDISLKSKKIFKNLNNNLKLVNNNKIYNRLEFYKLMYNEIFEFSYIINKIEKNLNATKYDEDFYKTIDINHNIFICDNGFLDLQRCIFHFINFKELPNISCNINFPISINTDFADKIINTIQEWLEKIFPDDEILEYVLNILACKLSGNINLLGEYLYIFTGLGSNGKKEFFKFIKTVFGNYYLEDSNKISKILKSNKDISTNISILASKRIVISPETKNNEPFDNYNYSNLINNKVLTYLDKDNIPLNILPHHAIFYKCNTIPRIDNDNIYDKLLDKIIIIPCESTFIIDDKDKYKLNEPSKYANHFQAINQSYLYKEWAPYFLYSLFQRFIELDENSFKFSIPEKITAATKQYQHEANTYYQFYREKIEEAPGYKVDAATLYLEFQQFVGRDFKTHKPTFLKQMERKIGRPKGNAKEYFNYRIFGTTGEQMESTF